MNPLNIDVFCLWLLYWLIQQPQQEDRDEYYDPDDGCDYEMEGEYDDKDEEGGTA